MKKRGFRATYDKIEKGEEITMTKGVKSHLVTSLVAAEGKGLRRESIPRR